MRLHRKILALGFSLLLNTGLVEGTPSTVFWTPCTTDVYATGTGHIDEDNYFTVSNRRGYGSFFPPDTGFELGVFSWKDLSAEAGIDYLEVLMTLYFLTLELDSQKINYFVMPLPLKLAFSTLGHVITALIELIRT